MQIRKLFIYAVLVFVPLSANAASGGEADQLEFVDARSSALGGGGYGLDSGAYSIGRNPSMLIEAPSPEFAFGDTFLPTTNGSIKTAAFVLPTKKTGVFAGYVNNLSVFGISGYDGSGNATGDFNYNNSEVGGAVGYRVANFLALGSRVGYNWRTMPDSQPGWFKVDAAMSFHPLAYDYVIEDKIGRITVGAVIENAISSKAEFDYDDYSPDFGVKFGGSWSHRLGKNQKILGICDVSALPNKIVSFGGEYSIAYTVMIRAGFDGEQPTFGVGFSHDLFDVDYAYYNRDLGAVHSVSFSVCPGRDRKARDMKRVTIERWLSEGRAYYATGNYEMAQRRFENVLEWESKHDHASYYKARCTYQTYIDEGKKLLKESDWERARRSFNAALVIYPDDYTAREYVTRVNELQAITELKHQQNERANGVISEADKEVRRGEYLGGKEGKRIIRSAIATLNSLDDELPGRNDVKTALRSASAALASIAPEVVFVPEIEIVRKEIPESARVRFEMGNDRLSAGRLDESIAILSPLVSEYPYYYTARSRLIEAYIYKGLDQYSKGYLSSAISTWQKVLNIDPGNSKAKRYISQAKSEIDLIRGPR